MGRHPRRCKSPFALLASSAYLTKTFCIFRAAYVSEPAYQSFTVTDGSPQPGYQSLYSLISNSDKGESVLCIGGTTNSSTSPNQGKIAAPQKYRPDRSSFCFQVVQESPISSSFTVTREATIPPGGSSHKVCSYRKNFVKRHQYCGFQVTIAEINLTPSLEYETVPSKEPLAFLVARAQNASSYPLLAGPASIYWDSTFVAKTQMKAVGPQEEIRCSLGADPAVRVEYKAPKKFLEGSTPASEALVMIHERKINIKNTRTDPVTVIVIDHHPISTDENVKVSGLVMNGVTEQPICSFSGDPGPIGGEGARLERKRNRVVESSVEPWSRERGGPQVQNRVSKRCVVEVLRSRCLKRSE